MDEFISREATIKRIKKVYCVGCNSYNGVRCRACGTGDAIDIIEDAPAADVVPVVRCDVFVLCSTHWIKLATAERRMTMAEYIDREALYEKAYWHGEHPDVGNPFPDGVDAIDIKDVDAIPAADVAPVRHGRWLEVREKRLFGEHYFLCSNCKSRNGLMIPFNYCPNCGSKMDDEP